MSADLRRRIKGLYRFLIESPAEALEGASSGEDHAGSPLAVAVEAKRVCPLNNKTMNPLFASQNNSKR